MTFSSPSFVITHEEHDVVSGRVRGSRYILTSTGRVRAAERNMFYHCNVACIQPRHPYFHMTDVVVHPVVMRELGEDYKKFLLSLGVRLYYPLRS